MNCEHLDQVLLYDVGELAQAEVEELEKHIENCETCAGYLKDLASLRDNKSLDTPVPASLHKFWVEKPKAKAHHGFSMIPPIIFAIAASVLVIIGITLFYNDSPAPDNKSISVATATAIEDQEIAEVLDDLFSFDSFGEPVLSNEGEDDLEKVLDSIENEIDQSVEYYTFEEITY